MIQAEKTAALIAEIWPVPPALAIVLGSGFNAFPRHLSTPAEVSYQDLPGFTQPRVEGHLGKLVLGRVDDVTTALLCGRSHYYEGHSLADITFPIRVLAAWGVKAVLLTNAAGGINPNYGPGDFMALTDHINFMGANPLRGASTHGESGFVDLSETYDPQLNLVLADAARRAQVRLHAGVYLAVSGPSYETPAEIRAFARLGADAVGMSTVPEAIVARQCGLRVAGISCITNPAAGLNSKAICHAEVLEAGARVQSQAEAILRGFVRSLGQSLS